MFLTNAASEEEELGDTGDVGCPQHFPAWTGLHALPAPTVLALEGP